jgi:hypothetical protein
MHEIEPAGFCTIQEYKRYLEKRKQASDLSIGGLYLIVAALKVGTKGQEAFKFPVNMKLIELGGYAIARLTVNLLDLDLQPSGEIAFTMEDGITKNPPIAVSSGTAQSVREMYIKDYEDYAKDDPGEASIEDEISQLELAVV